MDSSEKGSADIIKSDSGRVFVTQRALVGMQTVWSSILHLSTWLLRTEPDNQCVVCGGGIGRLKAASEILYRITNDTRPMKIG